MQKIVIQNFGAVKNADIEVRKLLVLIGEQASGKSTIAKLIYFFKSLRNDLFNEIYSSKEKENLDINSDLFVPIKEKFYNFFGSTFHLPDFNIRYYYHVEEGKYLNLSLDKNKKIVVALSPGFFSKKIEIELSNIKHLLQTNFIATTIDEQLADKQNKRDLVLKLSGLVNELFHNHQVDSLYVIAGRNSTVSYSDLFEKYLFANVQNSIEENKKLSFKRKQSTIDESLMFEFIERVIKIKDNFKKFGGFEGLIEMSDSLRDFAESFGKPPRIKTKQTLKSQLYEVKKEIDSILKGNYTIDNLGEKIVFDNSGGHTLLSNASSGQQESIRILQDIFMTILDDVKVLRILEEPEAHLFPIAQKKLIELLCLMVNNNPDNQLVIATHSPYVLSVFNNLLFANRVVEKNALATNEVAEIIPQKYWIDPKDFSAYSLGISNEKSYCKSIVNEKTKLIEQNYLDEVSQMLGDDFNELYAIHSKAFARK